MLWYRLKIASAEQGVGREDFEKWKVIERWLLIAGVRYPQNKKLQDLANKIADAPLQPLRSTRWLPTSYLSNRAYWRLIANEELFPQSVHGSTNPQLTCTV